MLLFCFYTELHYADCSFMPYFSNFHQIPLFFLVCCRSFLCRLFPMTMSCLLIKKIMFLRYCYSAFVVKLIALLLPLYNTIWFFDFVLFCYILTIIFLRTLSIFSFDLDVYFMWIEISKAKSSASLLFEQLTLAMQGLHFPLTMKWSVSLYLASTQHILILIGYKCGICPLSTLSNIKVEKSPISFLFQRFNSLEN